VVRFMNPKDWSDVMMPLAAINTLTDELSEELGGLSGLFNLPNTLPEAELELMKSVVECETLRKKVEYAYLRFNAIRIHFAKMRIKQLEESTAKPPEVTAVEPPKEQESEVGQGPVTLSQERQVQE
jgi:hypothetical protein